MLWETSTLPINSSRFPTHDTNLNVEPTLLHKKMRTTAGRADNKCTFFTTCFLPYKVVPPTVRAGRHHIVPPPHREKIRDSHSYGDVFRDVLSLKLKPKFYKHPVCSDERRSTNLVHFFPHVQTTYFHQSSQLHGRYKCCMSLTREGRLQV